MLKITKEDPVLLQRHINYRVQQTSYDLIEFMIENNWKYNDCWHWQKEYPEDIITNILFHIERMIWAADLENQE
jgi:hypothetical protein